MTMLHMNILLVVLSAVSVDAFQPQRFVHRTVLMQTIDDDKTETEITAAVSRLSSKTVEKEINYLENPYSLGGTRPAGAPLLAAENFLRQGSTILEQLYDVARDQLLTPKGEIPITAREKRFRPPGCLVLRLSNEAVKEAERIRESKPGGTVKTNIVARGLYDFGCLMLDSLFDERPIERFWFLETVARIPYFSYTS
jgi:hypothetical protein